MPVTAALERLRQEHHHKFEASLVYRESSRPACTTEQNPVSCKSLYNGSQKRLVRGAGPGLQWDFEEVLSLSLGLFLQQNEILRKRWEGS